MRELAPGVVRAGLRSWRVWASALAVGAAAAAWTAHSLDADSSPAPPAFALVRSAVLAFLSFLAVYACYLSTIMDAYVKESLLADMRDPLAFYGGSGGGGGGGGSGRDATQKQQQQPPPNHSCFWVAELIEGPPTTQQQQRQQQEEEEERTAAAAAAEANSQQPNTLRRRLLGLAGALAENERRAKEDALADAREMLAPRSPAPSSSSSAIVGCVALQHRPGEDAAELRRMSVADEARGRGVAVALGEALERHARARGLKRVFCTTSSLQPPARALYGGRLGWAEVPPPPDRRMREQNGVTFHRYEKVLG